MTESVEPWYRQFWPWFLISLPAAVVVAAISTVIVAYERADTLVVDDYYKQGLGINRQLEKDRVARQLGLAADIQVDGLVGELLLSLTSASDSSASSFDAALLMHWQHPTNEKMDFTLAIKHIGNGAYRGQLTHSLRGRWYVQLEGEQPQPWRLKREVQLSADETASESFSLGLIEQ